MDSHQIKAQEHVHENTPSAFPLPLPQASSPSGTSVEAADSDESVSVPLSLPSCAALYLAPHFFPHPQSHPPPCVPPPPSAVPNKFRQLLAGEAERGRAAAPALLGLQCRPCLPGTRTIQEA